MKLYVGALFRSNLFLAVTAAAKSLQSCQTLCDPRDGSPPGFPVPGFLQARTLEWVAISFSIWTLSLYYYIKHKITVSVLIQYKIFSIHPVFLIKISLRIFSCSRSIPRTTNMFILLGTGLPTPKIYSGLFSFLDNDSYTINIIMCVCVCVCVC